MAVDPMAQEYDLSRIEDAIRRNFPESKVFGVKATVDTIMEFIKKETSTMDAFWLQKATVTAINDMAQDAFARVPASKRFVFIPHCLRHIKTCKAQAGEEGYACLKCGACKINEIIKACERRGIRAYIVAGGSQLVNIVKKYDPSAVLGIACFAEVRMGLDKMMELGIPTQAVILSTCGCVNTDVNLDEVFAKINL
jgi:hypothetical protein